MITIAFFNNKGGVGKTSLVSHLAWMLSDLGHKVVVADLDPQANLTSIFVPEERLAKIWQETSHDLTVFGAMQPLIEGTGDIAMPHLEMIDDNLALIPGDLALSLCEDELNREWPQCFMKSPRAYRVISSFGRMIEKAARSTGADIALVDVGPNLGAINRAAMIAADHVVIPLAPDIYSLQGLTNLGRRLGEWRATWHEIWKGGHRKELLLPKGKMQPIGYVVMKHTVMRDKPVQAYDYWMTKIPNVYSQSLIPRSPTTGKPSDRIEDDVNCLAMLKDYRSLMPNAQRLHKPMFRLKSSDGVFGSNAKGVADCRDDFQLLAQEILNRAASLNLETTEHIAKSLGVSIGKRTTRKAAVEAAE